MKSEPLLASRGVSMRFFNQDGVVHVLDDITFEVQQGEIAALLGPSGCGKSTILNILSGLLEPTRGNVLRSGSIGYMFQRDHLLDWRTIYDNVCIGLEVQNLQKSEEHLQKVERLLKTYDLWEFRKRYPAELSGGMRQRAALIRTLAVDPAILLLDEPFSALDSQTRLMVSEDIGRIIQQEEKTTLLVTHDISEAISFADTIYTLSHRPSRVKSVYRLKLTTEGARTPLTSRKAPEFQQYFNVICEEMMQDAERDG
ncbi:MAG: ABC transporter ATP-binding protein [Peptococcaceae bacterium]|nr:ABC transporter ATP-binding protein [Peptococcaceae bacterium]